MLPVACLLWGLMLLAAPHADTPAATAGHMIHGTVTLAGGEVVTGFIRQEDDDACWDHLFEARRRESPWTDLIDMDALARERRAAYFASHGLLDRLAYTLEGGDRQDPGGRQFICRYVDLAVLDIDRELEVVTATMADGSTHELREGSRDLGGDLVLGGEDGRTVDWDDVLRVEFFPAPSGADPGVVRIWGELATADGAFAGWVRWDRSEFLTTDILDGDEANTDHEIPMGDIAAIARVNSRSCRVTLTDGRELVLSGSNDVNEDNRGIIMETAAYGRAVADWKTFRRLDFRVPPKEHGPVVPFTESTRLTATVTTIDGAVHTGNLVLDLDEGWAWEILDGHHGGIEYEIPLGNITAIEKDADGVCTVTTRDGSRLTMSTGQDTGPDNRGILVLGDGEPAQVAWSQVAVIRFAR
ncbi:hypothetical protein DRQ50_06580 [bacterium]|nr:MAG: hypothetical protein DRQ50_06580 [bacterium]